MTYRIGLFLCFIVCLWLGLDAHAALDGDPQYELLKQMRAECAGLTSVGKDEEALEVRRRILQQFPHFPFACAPTQYEIGQYYEKKGLTDKAMAEYAALVEKYPREDAAAGKDWAVIWPTRPHNDRPEQWGQEVNEDNGYFKIWDMTP